MNNEMVKVDPEEMNERTTQRGQKKLDSQEDRGRTEREVGKKEPYRPLAVTGEGEKKRRGRRRCCRGDPSAEAGKKRKPDCR